MFDGAGTLIDEQLGYEIARYVFGRPAEFRRRAPMTSRCRRPWAAAEGQTPKDLLSLARVGVAPAATAQN